jgi:hypothetical protein
MRTTIAAMLALSLLVPVAGVATAQPAYADHADVSFSFFYSNLSPHGSWHVSSRYGRVWQPAIYRPGWNPYYDGHWEYSNVGWIWVSDYRWGAVPYHYGTWVADPYYGWVWVPGYTWAPAWVVFRTGYDVIGWAPVSPSFTLGFSFGGGYQPAVSTGFVFVPTHQFTSHRIRRYAVPEAQYRTTIRNTTIVNNLRIENNVVVNRGPDVRVIERATGRRIQAAPVERVTRVSPFASVTRQQLAVPQERIERRKVRAAEPVSERQALPDVRADRTPRRQKKLEQQERQVPTERETLLRQQRAQRPELEERQTPSRKVEQEPEQRAREKQAITRQEQREQDRPRQRIEGLTERPQPQQEQAQKPSKRKPAKKPPKDEKDKEPSGS